MFKKTTDKKILHAVYCEGAAKIWLYLGYTLFTTYYESIRWCKVKYFKFTNKTQKEALKYLTEYDEYSNGKSYRCPECQAYLKGSHMFSEHISIVHGYPRDMDIEVLLSKSYIPKEIGYVKKADPNYLKYL